MTEQQHENELRRWQDRIRDDLQRHNPTAEIDGGGCESGDPLEFTLAEIGQAFGSYEDRASDALDELGLREAVAEDETSVDALIRLFTSDDWEPDVQAMRAELVRLRGGTEPASPNGCKLSDAFWRVCAWTTLETCRQKAFAAAPG